MVAAPRVWQGPYPAPRRGRDFGAALSARDKGSLCVDRPMPDSGLLRGVIGRDQPAFRCVSGGDNPRVRGCMFSRRVARDEREPSSSHA